MTCSNCERLKAENAMLRDALVARETLTRPLDFDEYFVVTKVRRMRGGGLRQELSSLSMSNGDKLTLDTPIRHDKTDGN